MINNDPVYVLDLLIQNELFVHKLYQIYAQKYIDYQQFWHDISNEEISHAKSLQALKDKYLKKEITFEVNRFNEKTIQFSIAFKQKMVEEVKNVDYEYIKAISIANSLEQAMLENKIFEVFDSDNEELKKTLIYLQNGTQNHLRKIKQAWEIANRSLFNKNQPS